MSEEGLVILLALQLAASIVAAVAWWRAATSESSTTIKLGAFASCAWFALFAGIIGYLFDTDSIWFTH